MALTGFVNYYATYEDAEHDCDIVEMLPCVVTLWPLWVFSQVHHSIISKAQHLWLYRRDVLQAYMDVKFNRKKDNATIYLARQRMFKQLMDGFPPNYDCVMIYWIYETPLEYLTDSDE